MKEYKVSARKYRPRKFSDIVGQSHIVKTLKNALKNKNLAQSFLFCGPRGVGKTTCARILAKAINCSHSAISADPCNECDSCVSFNKSSSFNIHELDAASNNSVEDIRSLVEQVRYAPQTGKYKIYIIDEVHMLSNAAFNAFLKTLEEPPSYAIFILATTEKHKIIPTILSRCQIYDFYRISYTDISKHLNYIAKLENINAEEEALEIISKKSDGSLRDALSMFDLIITYDEGNKLTYKSTVENLHILDQDYYFKILDAVFKKNIYQIFYIIDDIEKKGFNILNFISGVEDHLRNLLFVKYYKNLEEDLSKKFKLKYIEQSNLFNEIFLINALNILSKCELNYKYVKNKKLSIELALLNLIENIEDTSQIQKKKSSTPHKIEDLNKEVPIKKKSISDKLQKSTSTKTNYENKLDSTLKILDLDQISEIVKKDNTPNFKLEDVNTAYKNIDTKKIYATWKIFLDILKEEGKYTEYNILNNALAIENNSIFITLNTELEKNIFLGIQQRVKAYIYEKTSYNVENITYKVLEKKNEYVPYTNQEKFEYLEKKNHNLTKLKNAMDLDLNI